MERFILPPGPVPPKTVRRGTVEETQKTQRTYDSVWISKCDGMLRGEAEMSAM